MDAVATWMLEHLSYPYANKNGCSGNIDVSIVLNK